MDNSIEDTILLIKDPLSEKEFEFSLNLNGNASLAMRLIKKRENIRNSVIKDSQKLKELREKSNMADLEKRIKSTSSSFRKLDPDSFESDEAFKEESERIEKELREIRDLIPQEVIDLQNSLADRMYDLDRLSIKICSMVLNPHSIPEEYNGDKASFIEEIVPDESGFEDIISFFLDSITSVFKSRRVPQASVRIKGEEG